jgi:hypothetical protein
MKVKTAYIVALVLGVIMIFREQQKPRGIRNNNPLNIRENGTNWRGKVGDDGEFVQFESEVFGIRAATKIFKTYRDKYGLNSIAAIISRWSPPSENDTTSYIDSVASKIGVSRNETLLDFHYPELIKAMIYHENGQQPYDDTTIEQGFKAGFYA